MLSRNHAEITSVVGELGGEPQGKAIHTNNLISKGKGKGKN